MKGFKNITAYVDGKFIKTNIGFENGKILYVGKDENSIDEEIKVDGIVLPGYIDEHTHGTNGFDTMDGTQEAINEISKAITKEGVTAFCATTMNADDTKLCSILRNASSAKTEGAKVVGIHMEGPFISEAKKGAQPSDFIKDPSIALAENFIENSNGKLKIVTLAPEKKNCDELIKFLKEHGVTCSAGHTSATYAEYMKGVSAGVSCTTHTFNGMSSFNHREIGVAGGAMKTDVYNEIIADGMHVDFNAIQILASLKADKLIAITDAIRAKGLGDCVSELGGQTVYVKDGQARLSDGTFAGSTLTLDKAVRNLVMHVGLTKEQAINTVTVNPAKNMGIFNNYGSISVGKFACFTVVDDSLNVLSTFVDGEKVY